MCYWSCKLSCLLLYQISHHAGMKSLYWCMYNSCKRASARTRYTSALGLQSIYLENNTLRKRMDKNLSKWSGWFASLNKGLFKWWQGHPANKVTLPVRSSATIVFPALPWGTGMKVYQQCALNLKELLFLSMGKAMTASIHWFCLNFHIYSY